jgi:hypothetical protein
MYIPDIHTSSKHVKDTMVRKNYLYISKCLGILLYSWSNQYFNTRRIGDYRNCWSTRPDYQRYRFVYRFPTFFRGRNKEKHYNKTYRGLVGLSLKQIDDYRLQLHTVKCGTPDRLEFFQFAIPHLSKKHGDEYKNWEEINRNLEQYNLVATETWILLKNLIKTKMGENYLNYNQESHAAFPEISKENYYKLLVMVKDIYEHKYRVEKSGLKTNFNFNKTPIGNTYQTKVNSLKIENMIFRVLTCVG